MKIGILTFHDGPNHGAFLQAYATLSVLGSAGHDVSIINYKNKKHYKLENSKVYIPGKNPIAYYQRIRKHLCFKQAHKLLPMSEFTTEPNVVKGLGFDCIVVGSDVVWNYEIFGYDSLYMGQLGHCRKVAYAPSCGQVSYDQSHPDNMANDLVNFDSLSARDTNTQKMLKHLIGRNAPLVLDPTLIYDFCAETAKTSRKISNPYLLAYAYNYPYGNLSQVEEYATQNGLDVLGVGYHESFGKSFCSSFLSGVGPFEWIQLFQAAHTILTSTFHGVIFSLKSRKPFFYITNKRAFNRVKSLLDTAGIDNSIHAEDEGKILYFNPDYDQVEAHFKPLIDFSRKWLLESVSL